MPAPLHRGALVRCTIFSILSRLPWEHKSAQAEVYKAAGAVLYYSKTQKEGILWTKLPSGGRSAPKSRP